MDMAQEMGFRGMEIQTGKANMPPSDIGTDAVQGIRKVLRYAEKHGLRIHSLATYNDFSYVKDEVWRLANIEYIKKWLRLARDTGVPNIHMLTGYLVQGEAPQRLEPLAVGTLGCRSISHAPAEYANAERKNIRPSRNP